MRRYLVLLGDLPCEDVLHSARRLFHVRRYIILPGDYTNQRHHGVEDHSVLFITDYFCTILQFYVIVCVVPNTDIFVLC